MTTLHLEMPPTIFRKAISDISQNFPGSEIRPRQNHEELAHFFQRDFGRENRTADLTVTAYPVALQKARSQEGRSLFRPLPADYPPVRTELANIGYREPDDFFKVIAVIPFMIIYHKSVTPAVTGWSNLCQDYLAAATVIPPASTPAPAAFASYMERICGLRGKKAAQKVHARLLSQEINKAVDNGDYKAGLVLPAFARTFQQGNGLKVWPAEGAITLPLLAFVKKSAPEEADQVLRFLLDKDFQTFVSCNGLIIPARPDVPLFVEMSHANGRLHWLGWERYCRLANTAA